MDGATIAAKVQAGYGKAGAIVGQPHTQYRPPNPMNPLLLQIGMVLVAFEVSGKFRQAKPDQIIWEALANGSLLNPGDYLVGTHTWGVLQSAPIMPPLVMRCNDQIASVSRVAEAFTMADGATQTENVIAQNIPCYIALKRDKGFGAPKDFPGGTDTSAPLPEWLVYVPLGGVFPVGFFQDGDLLSVHGEQWRVDAAASDTIMWQLACTSYIPNA